MSLATDHDSGPAGRPEPPEWMSLSDYAQHIGVNKSTISRQVGTVIPTTATRRQGRTLLINVAAADQARRDNVDQAQQRLPVEASAPSVGGNPTYAGAKARKEHYAAEAAELAHKKALGLLLDKQAVVDAAISIGVTMRGELEGRRQLLAIDLAGITDPAEIVAKLEASDDRLMLRLQQVFTEGVGLAADAA
jgi:hypothetical protein